MTVETTEIAVIGAGPYGLAATAHLTAAGRDVRLFGKTLEFWRTQTPIDMVLRSPLRGSDIGHPQAGFTYCDFEREVRNPVVAPIPVERFVAYGDWFRQQTTPQQDPRDVGSVNVDPNGGFRLVVGDDVVRARRVVVAAGIGTFAAIPRQFAGIDPALVSHSLAHHDLRPFAGRRVSVVGGGQSALESAALLHELGADVDVLVRAPRVFALSESSWRHTTWPVNRILYAAPDVGPALRSHLVARPSLYRRMPRGFQDSLAVRALRPAGAGWLQPRLRDIPVRTGVEIGDCEVAGDALKLRLGDGTIQPVDHVLLATGYRVDLARYPFLDTSLVPRIACVGGYPELSSGFETTIPGLHIVGAPAAWSFGPLMRFVAGSGFAARTLARGIRR